VEKGVALSNKAASRVSVRTVLSMTIRFVPPLWTKENLLWNFAIKVVYTGEEDPQRIRPVADAVLEYNVRGIGIEGGTRTVARPNEYGAHRSVDLCSTVRPIPASHRAKKPF
jgi:hypothetical protein